MNKAKVYKTYSLSWSDTKIYDFIKVLDLSVQDANLPHELNDNVAMDFVHCDHDELEPSDTMPEADAMDASGEPISQHLIADLLNVQSIEMWR